MDRDPRKSELEAEKTDIDTRIATLQTKDGADAFIAEQKADIDAVLPRLRDRKLPSNQISMKQFLEINKKLLDKHPTEYITREIAQLERRVTELEKEIKETETRISSDGTS